MLDAPVSGSVLQVQSGTLTIMVGGDEAYSRVQPALRELGTPARIGDNGQGLVLKLTIDISLAVQMFAFSEGLLLAQRDGIDPKLAAEVTAHKCMRLTAVCSPGGRGAGRPRPLNRSASPELNSSAVPRHHDSSPVELGTSRAAQAPHRLRQPAKLLQSRWIYAVTR